jgi:hypothetical protein
MMRGVFKVYNKKTGLEKPSPFEFVLNIRVIYSNPRNPGSDYFAQQQSQPSTHGAFGEHLSPHLQSQHAADLALTGVFGAGVLLAKLVAVSVNKRPEMKTKSFFI